MSEAAAISGFELQRAALAVDGVSGPEKAVLLVLSMMAGKHAKAWPPIGGPTGLTAKCSLSERTVQRAIQSLKDAGHISREEILGRGVVYTVHPRQSDAPTPVTVTPRQSDAPVTVAATPVTVAPKQPVTTIPSEAEASSGSNAGASGAPPRAASKKRDPPPKGGRLPPEFVPTVSGKAAEIVAGWPPGKLDAEIEQWRAHHDARGATMKDWDAAFRTWVHNAEKFGNRYGRPSQPATSLRGSRPDPALDMWRQAQAEIRAAEDPGADCGSRIALPPYGEG